MPGHVEVQNTPTIMGEHEEYVEDLKPERWHGEEILGGHPKPANEGRLKTGQ